MKYRVLITDPGRRFIAGEIGEELPNDYPEKYDHKLDLAPEEGGTEHVLFGKGRVFYFRSSEVVPIRK
jgi:hypothetical protein